MDDEEKVSSLAVLMICLHGIISHHLSGWLTGKKVTNVLMAQPPSQWQSPKVLSQSQCRATKGTGQLISPLLLKTAATLLEILPCPDNKMLSRKDFAWRKITSRNGIMTAPQPVPATSPLSQSSASYIEQHWQLHRRASWQRKLIGEKLSKGASLGVLQTPAFVPGRTVGRSQAHPHPAVMHLRSLHVLF